MKRTIVILTAFYLPGFKAGGPVRSIQNLVAALGSEFRFKIVTLDRDLGDRAPYPNITVGKWTQFGNADVLYLRPGWRGTLDLANVLRKMSPEATLYLNSYFSRRFSMLPMLFVALGLCRPLRVVLAPRGEFSSGARGIKKLRKHLYILLARLLGIYRGIHWHASTDYEKADILSSMPGSSLVRVAKVLASNQDPPHSGKTEIIRTAKDIHFVSGIPRLSTVSKRTGELRLVFVSRISPMKHLLGAISMLRGVSGDISFDIYGPIEDQNYWTQCREEIDRLPVNIRVGYMGLVNHEQVAEVFSAHDLFLFPTLGENYGHVICEALSAGCPVLISDQTPWRHLRESGAGWDLPLSRVDQFREVLQQCADADRDEYAKFVTRAAEYGKAAAADPSIIEENRNMFKSATSFL
jgi:glycosyltransferase involved in cell wall biosynthesis